MKIFLVATCFVFMVSTASAQVYTINPVYECTTIESKGSGPSLYAVDTFTRGTFIVDLDNMIFTNPITILSEPKKIVIKNVTRLDNNLIKLKLKKDNRYSPDLYYLQLDAAGKPLYVQKDDIIFETYTTTASALVIGKKCTRLQTVTVPYTTGDPAPDDTLEKAKKKALYIEGRNSFELNNGALTWTEGKGKDAVVHNISIDKSYASVNKKNSYVQLIGEDATGTSYNVMFCYTNGGYPAYSYVYVEQMKSDSWTSMSFY